MDEPVRHLAHIDQHRNMEICCFAVGKEVINIVANTAQCGM